MLAQCKEVQHPLRRNEKSILNQINGGKVRFKVKGIAVKNVANSKEMKSNILIQAGIGRIPIQDDSLCAEMVESMEASERILRAAVEFLTHQNRGEALSITYSLWRSIKLRSWSESIGATFLQQIHGIGAKEARALECMGIQTIDQLAKADPSDMNRYISRDREFCSSLIQEAGSVIEFDSSMAISSDKLRITVNKKCGERDTPLVSSKQSCTVIVWCRERLLLCRDGIDEPSSFTIELPSELRRNNSRVFARVFHEQYVGMDQRLELNLNENEQPQDPCANQRQNSAEEQGCKETSETTESTNSEAADSVENGDSHILSKIKALERHQTKAKQQSLFRFLTPKPRVEPHISALVEEPECIDITPPTLSARAYRLNQISQLSEVHDLGMQSANCVGRMEIKPTIDENYLPKISRSTVCTSPPRDRRNKIDRTKTTLAEIKLPGVERGANKKKRRPTENIFAHFRFKKRSDAEREQASTNKKRKGKAIAIGDKQDSRHLRTKGGSYESLPKPGSCEIYATARNDPTNASSSRSVYPDNMSSSTTYEQPDSVESLPFFKAYMREKTMLVCVAVLLLISLLLGKTSARPLGRNQYAAASALVFNEESTPSSSSLCGEQLVKETGSLNGLYYIFYETSSSTASSGIPVILWLSGGPRCSGLVGDLFELGPCVFDDETGGVAYNPHSWTSLAHVIFIDQPRGTGFSDPDTDNFWTHQDSSQDMVGFLKQFFSKHSELASHDFYIFGESYGGHFVPDLAQYLLKSDAERWTPQLKGIGIGNGLASPKTLIDSFVQFAETNAYSKDLLGANKDELLRFASLFADALTQRDRTITDQGERRSLRANSAAQFCNDAVSWYEEFNSLSIRSVYSGGWNGCDMRRKCHLDDRIGLCYRFSRFEDFVNQDAVLECFGVPTQRWTLYTMQMSQWLSKWDVLEESENGVAYLLDRGVRVLVYGGDADTVVNWKSQDKWTRQLEWSHHDAFSTAPMNQFSWNGESVGEIRTAHGLSFMKVYHVGHVRGPFIW
ncbi:Serine protease family s10, partial [Globisporangium splendens]